MASVGRVALGLDMSGKEAHWKLAPLPEDLLWDERVTSLIRGPLSLMLRMTGGGTSPLPSILPPLLLLLLGPAQQPTEAIRRLRATKTGAIQNCAYILNKRYLSFSRE